MLKETVEMLSNQKKKIVRRDYPLPNTKSTSLNKKFEKLNHKF
jgi:hypothetical protein